MNGSPCEPLAVQPSAAQDSMRLIDLSAVVTGHVAEKLAASEAIRATVAARSAASAASRSVSTGGGGTP